MKLSCALRKCINLLMEPRRIALDFSVGRYVSCAVGLLFLAWMVDTARAESPDVATVEPDLIVPTCLEAEPSAGKRVFCRFSDSKSPDVYHCLYLPVDWKPETKYPILVEWGGNRYRSVTNDESTGKPEDTCLGYGLSGGKNCIWLSVPFLSSQGNQIATTWWGEPPEYDSKATLAYCKQALNDACQRFGADPDRAILCGFSRGAIACNYLGLSNDEFAGLWKAMFVCSHYDGIRKWSFPNSVGQPAIDRLQRLGSRSQFICDEDMNQLLQIQAHVQQYLPNANVTFQHTGFRNHTDKWILRPSDARTKSRVWLQDMIQH
jgi:hypothetical protein